MNVRPIIDAGPSLNFFATNRERLLFTWVGPLHIPETVHAGVLRKSRQDRRFASARAVLNRLPAKLLDVLSDESTPALDAVVERIVGFAGNERRRQAKDLGELMVVAHAVVTAEQGHQVTVLIDDGDGRRIATAERRRLERLLRQGREVGSIGPGEFPRSNCHLFSSGRSCSSTPRAPPTRAPAG